MKAVPSFEAVQKHERFRLTAHAAESGFGWPYVQLLVQDTDSGATLRINRAELMPLLRAIKEILKAVEDAVAGLPSDPVERAARRIPSQGIATSFFRAHVLKAYAQELADLRERYLQRFDDETRKFSSPTPHPTESAGRPPSPHGGEGDRG
jgi:hypothetical protein